MTNGQDKTAGPQEPRRRGDGEVTDHPVTAPEPWPDWLADLTPDRRIGEILNAHAARVLGMTAQDAPYRLSFAEASGLLSRLLGEARRQAPVPSAEHSLAIAALTRLMLDEPLTELRDDDDRARLISRELTARMQYAAGTLETITRMGAEAAEAPREPQGGNPSAEVPSEPVMELLEYASDLIGRANEDGSLGGAAVDRWRDRYRALVAEYAAAKAGRSPEPKAEPAPPLPAGDHGRMELPGFRSHTGWWTPGVLAGQAVMVCSDRDGNPVAEYIPGPASRFVRLPVPTVAASEARALGWSGDDDDDPDDYAAHARGCHDEHCNGDCVPF